MRRVLLSVVAVALCLAHATMGRAAQVTQPMNVSLTIGTPGGEVSLTVGSLVMTGPQGGPYYGSTTVHVTAPANLPYVISLNQGLHYNGYRRLLPSNPLASYHVYYLYNANTNELWGDNNHPELGPPVNGLGTGSDQAYTANAEAAAKQVLNGTYTDVVTVTVDF